MPDRFGFMRTSAPLPEVTATSLRLVPCCGTVPQEEDSSWSGRCSAATEKRTVGAAFFNFQAGA
jgi:hypothetical protein